MVHLSNLICSTAISKTQGKEMLEQAIVEKGKMEQIKEMVLTKLKLTSSELDEIMDCPIVPHSNYKSYFVYNPLIQQLIKGFKKNK